MISDYPYADYALTADGRLAVVKGHRAASSGLSFLRGLIEPTARLADGWGLRLCRCAGDIPGATTLMSDASGPDVPDQLAGRPSGRAAVIE